MASAPRAATARAGRALAPPKGGECGGGPAANVVHQRWHSSTGAVALTCTCHGIDARPGSEGKRKTSLAPAATTANRRAGNAAANRRKNTCAVPPWIRRA